MDLTAVLYDSKGEKIKDLTLEPNIFGIEMNEALLAQAVKVYLSNQRRGTANTKGRGEVSGGGRKPWRQKGTGRARQGSTRAPHWYKGGVAHGPEPRDWSHTLNRKMKRRALLCALSSKAQENAIAVINGLNVETIETKPIAALFEKISPNKSTLLVLPKLLKNVYLSSRNITQVTPVIFKDMNVYDVLNHNQLVFLEETLTVMREVFLKENQTKEETQKAAKETVLDKKKPITQKNKKKTVKE